MMSLAKTAQTPSAAARTAGWLMFAVVAGTAVAQVQWTPRELLDRFADPVAFDVGRARLVLYTGGLGLPPVPETWEWDAVRWQRRAPALSPPSRSEHAIGYDLLRGRTVLFGGSGPSNDTWEWDGNNWQLAQPATSPSPRAGAAMTFDLLRGRMVMFGGVVSNIFGTVYLADTWEWDGATWVQRSAASSPPARAHHGLAFDIPRGRAVLFGGESALGLRGDTWEWDGATWVQRFSAAQPPARSRCSFGFDLARGRSVLFSGQIQGGIAADTWEWDGIAWNQRVLATAPPQRTDGGMAFDAARGVMLLASGRRASFVHGDLWQWDGSLWTRLAEAAVPPARHSAAVTWDSARSRLLVFGGLGATTNLQDFWEWDGVRWRELLPTSLPSARGRGAMVFDSGRSRAVMFGGELPGFTNETWEWDGAVWQRTATTGPDPRIDFAMAFDAWRGRTVLFGGLSSPPSPRGDTWEWDGSNWLQRTPVVAPAPRSAHAMAFDARRQVTVLFGGAGAGLGNLLGDTWEWDGASWLQRLPANAPPARAEHALTYDPARQRIVLFGGGSANRNDTWEWDGVDWTQRAPATAPPPRQRHDLAFDRVLERVVLFGGSSIGPNFADLWELAAVQPAAMGAFGTGCASSAGTLVLDVVDDARPWLGDTIALRLSPLPAGAPVLFALGASRTAWGAVPLPLPLDTIGMPGCVLLASVDELAFLLPGGATATLAVTVPVQPSLLGVEFYLQGAAFDAAANAAGLVTSNALAGVVGAR